MGHRVRLFTSHPPAQEEAASDDDDEQFYELNWVRGSKVSNDDMSAFAEVNCRKPGAFSYFFLTDHGHDIIFCFFILVSARLEIIIMLSFIAYIYYFEFDTFEIKFNT